jgi:DNA-binding transcriptional regulator GbsR (MarR family)
MHPKTLSLSQQRMIETASVMCQKFGMPKSVGQIFGLLYFSPTALSLDDIAIQLGVSKASASTGTRQLLGWGAIRQVWKVGDRKDYYEAQGDISEILRTVFSGHLRPKLESVRIQNGQLREFLDSDLKSGSIESDVYQICRKRLDAMTGLQDRVERLLPLAEKLF